MWVTKQFGSNGQTVISQQAWDMLSPDDQAECMSHLPSFDVVWDHSKNGDDVIASQPKLVDGFFEKNLSLQEDIRTFQVTAVPQRSVSDAP
jgi:hypothetical protein